MHGEKDTFLLLISIKETTENTIGATSNITFFRLFELVFFRRRRHRHIEKAKQNVHIYSMP